MNVQKHLIKRFNNFQLVTEKEKNVSSVGCIFFRRGSSNSIWIRTLIYMQLELHVSLGIYIAQTTAMVNILIDIGNNNFLQPYADKSIRQD